MALKDVLEDKKKKRTITIVGTIAIILVTAGVFSYEASSIEVKEPMKGGVTTGETVTQTGTATGNETGNYHYENDGTIQGSSGVITWGFGQENEYFPVEAGAKRAVITVSSDKDIDLYIYNADDEFVDSSASAETTETVEIKGSDLANTGEWRALIKHYSAAPRPMNSADYHIVIDVYYE